MKIKFQEIHLSNFMSFYDSTINLDDLGYTLVSGVNNNTDDSSESNGSGKSSIWEGIIWSLTGETIRGHKNVTNLFGDNGALVELTFYVDNDKYFIRRTKDHSKLKSSLYIEINGENKSGKGIRDSEALLQQYLPDINAALISSVIILGQGLPQRFTANTPAGRKQILEQLSKSDFMIEDLKKRIANRSAVLNSKATDCNLQIARNEATEKTLTEQIEDAKKKFEETKTFGSVEELTAQIKELDNQLSEQTSYREDLQNKLADLDKELSNVKDTYTEVQRELDKELYQLSDAYQKRLTDYKINANGINKDISSAKVELNRLQSITDICPTCGQKLIGVEKPDVTPVLNKIRELEESYKDELRRSDLIAAERDRKLDECKSKYTGRLNELTARRQELSNNRTVESNKVQQATYAVDSLRSKIQEIKNKLAKVESAESYYSELINKLSDQRVDVNGKKLYYINELENTKQHQEVVKKMETIIKRDFRGLLLENVISFIDKKSKEYCQVVFGTEDISFKQDGNNISISYGEKEYESLSGGEQKKLDIIIQLSIRDMLCNLLNFSSNILICDEIFDALDSLGCQNVINLVATKLDDVSSVFIVTHRDNLSIPCDNKITVIKDENKISHVVCQT